MRAKVFVSYKYADNSVAQLPSLCKCGKVTTARNYVDIFIHRAQKKNIIVYKGEMNGEDLSDFSKDYIWNTLKDRIFDSSLTIVFISPNMMELYKKEDSQWIPQEIAFSLKESTRNGRTSHSNALLFVVLPDSYGATNYITYMNHFEIIRRNIDNKYGVLTTWGNFINNIENCLNLAYEKAQKSIPYKQINNKENIYDPYTRKTRLSGIYSGTTQRKWL